MNERVMQFRIGMFVIVAGLVLTMLIVWFGESPSLLRDHVYVIARYEEAPGVAEGIAVRKSGIRIGEVHSIAFDERPGQPDGVLVTLSLERKFRLKEGSVPRVTRSLIGDASIDMLPGTSSAFMKTSKTMADAPIIEGAVSPDPSKALAAATEAFEKVGDTLKSIDAAAAGIADVAKSADDLNEFLVTWKATGQRLGTAAEGIDEFLKGNQSQFGPALASLKSVAEKLDATFDPTTQDSLKSGVAQFTSASTRLNTALAQAGPIFKDLGSAPNVSPTTDAGQALRRLNIMSADLALLASALRDPSGKLNTRGSLQKMLTQPELFDNLNRMALSGGSAFDGIRPILAYFRTFAEKIARDPSVIAKGALAR